MQSEKKNENENERKKKFLEKRFEKAIKGRRF